MFKSIEGMTLTELLVASTMIGILMIGTVSFSFAIKRLQNSTNRSAILAMKMNAAMAEISQDATLAVGNAADQGVYAWTNNKDTNSICFRQDLPNTPWNYTDDAWVCYFHDGSFDIQRCPGTTHSFPPACTMRSQCCADVPSSKQTQLLSITKSVSEYAEIVNDINGRFEYIKLNLTSRYDKNSPIHPITNPQYTLTTRISPPGHSR